MASQQHTLTGHPLRLVMVFLFAITLFLSSALPGYAEGTGTGGGLPPDAPADTTTSDGGTNSIDDGSSGGEQAATQDAVDASWTWTIDLLQLLSSAIL